MSTFQDLTVNNRLFVGNVAFASALDGEIFTAGAIRASVVECGALKATIVQELSSVQVSNVLTVTGSATIATLNATRLAVPNISTRDLYLDCVGTPNKLHVSARYPNDLVVNGNLAINGAIATETLIMNQVSATAVSLTFPGTLTTVGMAIAGPVDRTLVVSGGISANGRVRGTSVVCTGRMLMSPNASPGLISDAVGAVRTVHANAGVGLGGYRLNALPSDAVSESLVDETVMARAAVAAAGNALVRLDNLANAVTTQALTANTIQCDALSATGSSILGGITVLGNLTGNSVTMATASVQQGLVVSGNTLCGKIYAPGSQTRPVAANVNQAVEVVRSAFAANAISLGGYWSNSVPASLTVGSRVDEFAMARAAAAAAGNALSRLDELTSGAWAVPSVQVGLQSDGSTPQMRQGWGVWCDAASGNVNVGGTFRKLTKTNGVEIVSADPGVTTSVSGGSGFFAGKVVAGEFVVFSDARLKKDITPVSPMDCTALVKGLKPRAYRQHEDVKYGFIAQDLLEIVPEAVRRGPGMIDGVCHTDVLSVDGMQIIALLAGSLRDMALRVETLENSLAMQHHA